MCVPFRHKWSKWGKPVPYQFGSKKSQWRTCCTCGKTQRRVINDCYNDIRLVHATLDLSVHESKESALAQEGS